MKRISVFLIAFFAICAMQLQAQTPTEMPTGRRFHIQSAMNFGKDNGGYWDIPGRPSATTDIARGSNIQVWNLDNLHDREFSLIRTSANGYYEIQVGNTRNSRVDIQGRGTQNGANVHTWTPTGNPNQHFLFHHLGNGRFKIYDRNSGKILCLEGRRNANGTNIHLWQDHNGASVEWYLIDVSTKQAFVPQPVSRNPDFFIKNKYFIYETESMVGRSKGTAEVQRIQGNRITLNIKGTSYNSDVPPGQPTETDFNRNIEITYENGKYLYMTDLLSPGELRSDGKTLSFSGDFYVGFTVSSPPAPLGDWVKNNNTHSLGAYLSRVSYADLVSDDNDAIATEISKLPADRQSSLVAEIIRTVQNNEDAKVRDHVYTELNKATYKRASFLIRATLTAGFNNFIDNEKDTNLKNKIQNLHNKMVNAR